MRKFALISTYNKEGVSSLANAFVKMGYELLSTGGTKEHLEKEGFTVTGVSELTDEPERFGGRVKTLHHKIMGAILFRPGQDEKEWPYDFRIGAVVCNFYPFKEKAKDCETLEEMADWVDIGGPTMVRAAAKNFNHVWVLTRVVQYTRFIMGKALHQEEGLSKRLALEAFEDVARLDRLIVSSFYNKVFEGNDVKGLKYGENPHQKAWFVPNENIGLKTYGRLSFNNIRDVEAAFRFVAPFHGPTVSVIKHQNLCGAASSIEDADKDEVFAQAWEGDTVSRFGSIIALNFVPTDKITEKLKKHFIEAVVLPRSLETEEFAEKIRKEKEKLRVVLVDESLFGKASDHEEIYSMALGELHQEPDFLVNVNPDQKVKATLLKAFGQWTAACSKSNSITMVGLKDDVIFLAGAGQGQPNRVDALKLLAIPRAKAFCERQSFSFAELSCFSDAFIPFRDTLDVLHESGVKRLFQPGGSKKDEELIGVAKELGIDMVMTRERHFWH